MTKLPVLQGILGMLLFAAVFTVALAAAPLAADAAPDGQVIPVVPAAPAAPPKEKDQQCEVPPELAPLQDPLPGLARALRDQTTPKTIVVLGSLSNSVKGEAGGIAGYPSRLQARLDHELAAHGADAAVKIESVGKTRALAGELTVLIKRQVLPLKPALVIWQVGRADARQGNPPKRFSQSLADGLDILQQHAIDTILLDIQFHPQFEALYRTDDYRDYLRWLAGKRDLPLLQRYDMVEHWASTGLIDLDSGNEADQQAAYDFIQECVAYQAARMIIGGIELARPR